MYKYLAAALHLKKQCNVLKKLKLKPNHELQPAKMIFSLQVSKTKLTPGVHRDLKANYVVQRPGEKHAKEEICFKSNTWETIKNVFRITIPVRTSFEGGFAWTN